MKQLLTFFCVLLFSASLSAQQYGHCSFGELIGSMKETAAAEKTLKTFNDGLVAEGEARAKAIQQEIEAYAKKKEAGELSPLQQQQMEADLIKKRDALYAYEQEVASKTDQKREELLEPVITRANEVIEAIAKERGLKLVFDTSIFNAVLFADESMDLMAEAKKRLGIE